jgi:predicted HicB family RNase H-like nuclease
MPYMNTINYFKYKGYIGSIMASAEDQCLYGKILFINDLITYEAETVADLKIAFEDAVEDYLETCKKLGKKPQQTCKGTLNVRIGPELHREAALFAEFDGVSLNEYIKKALVQQIQNSQNLYGE